MYENFIFGHWNEMVTYFQHEKLRGNSSHIYIDLKGGGVLDGKCPYQVYSISEFSRGIKFIKYGF